MDRSVEATGKTIEEARQAAMRMLGVDDASRVTFEELPDKVGLFNRTMKQVRASLAPESAPSPPPPPPPPPAPVVVEAAPLVEAPVPAPEPVRYEEPAPPVPSEPKEPGVQELLAAALGPDEETEPVEITSSDVQRAVKIMQSVMDAARVRVDVKHQKTEGRYIHLAMSGPDVPHMIGRRGAVIDALQYLANVMFCKGPEECMARLVLDGDDYRARRAMTLQKIATELAQQVRERGEEAELEPLPAHERRIVHRVLRDDQGVKTYSEGVEPERRVVISPAPKA